MVDRAEADSGVVGGVGGRLRRLIATNGSVPVGLFMSLANDHYYATRDPLGAAGDFITAPEMSQMFGELIGLWAADLSQRAGAGNAAWVELGPGRGTLSADALRVMARFDLRPPVHFVETSPVLRDRQAAAVPGARFHADATTLPDDRPLIVIANEFFDALPIRQLIRTAAGWRERVITLGEGGFVTATAGAAMDAGVPEHLRDAPIGSILETSPVQVAVARDLAALIAAQGGALLVVDYGHAETAIGDTLQAVAGHAPVDVFADPGERDITAHVDLGALAACGRDAGLKIAGPVGQGAFLRALGIDARSEALASRQPERRATVLAQRDRLTGTEAMGALFKAMAMHHPDWPVPEGFA